MGKLLSGFGCVNPHWVLHIANRPELEQFEHDDFRQLKTGEVKEVIASTSNHWRKVFSIVAKISFALFETGCETWQEYRDTHLLTDKGFEAISYLPYKLEKNNKLLSIVCGFSYAETQLQLSQLVPHQAFPKLLALPGTNCFVTPYFDWRQLNNEHLAVLINMMENRLLTTAGN